MKHALGLGVNYSILMCNLLSFLCSVVRFLNSCCCYCLYLFLRSLLALYRSHQPNSTVAFRNFEEEARQSAVWDSEQDAMSSSRDNLASLYRPPFALMFNGPFDKVSWVSLCLILYFSLASTVSI
jgi:hypothetical protein